MATYSIFFLLAHLLLSVQAGHFQWDNYKGNLTEYPPAKRWLAVEASEGGTQLWPDKTIKYYFKDSESKSKLQRPMKAAMEIWYAANLPRDFKMVEVKESEFNKNRDKVLLVSYNDKGILSTTPGLPPADPSTGYVGPSMSLSTNSDMGMLNTEANIAHEIGHAWGLVHEHQNLYLWGSQSVEGRTDPVTFSPSPISNIFTFNCKALKDYATASAGLSDDEIWGYDGICTNRAKAAEKQFSAMDYLPFFGSVTYSRGYAMATDDDVDWDSIMLYPSGAGGSGEGATPDNDIRESVILKASDGSKIPPKLSPSTRDIEGMNKLYSTKWSTGRPLLANDPKSPDYSVFQKLFGGCLGRS